MDLARKKVIQSMALDIDLTSLFITNTEYWEQINIKVASKAAFYCYKGFFSMKGQQYLKKYHCMKMQL